MTMGWLIPESVKRKIRRRAGAITIHDRLLNLRTCGFNPKQMRAPFTAIGRFLPMAFFQAPKS